VRSDFIGSVGRNVLYSGNLWRELGIYKTSLLSLWWVLSLGGVCV